MLYTRTDMKIPCEITFDDPNGNGVYYAGQVVSGRVTLYLKKKLRVDNISVIVKGYSYWTIQVQKSRNRSITFKCSEQFINETSHVIQSAQSGSNVELPIGEHVYKFASYLPRAIPPSFERGLGHIRYRIILLIKRAWRLNTIKRIVQFNVLIPLNLNTFDAQIREPKSFDKNYTFYFSNQPKLELKIGLERTGFAIGDTMRINVDAKNHSKSKIDSIYFSIIQKILYTTARRGKSKTFTERNTKYKDKTRELPPLSHTNFDHCITVPYMPVTINSSWIISVGYELSVSASSQWTSKCIPIIIGNIPFMDLVSIN